jgi:hypothetical protein
VPGVSQIHRAGSYAQWATAAEPMDEKGALKIAYQGNRQSGIKSGLEGSRVTAMLREMLKGALQREGMTIELLPALNERTNEGMRLSRS